MINSHKLYQTLADLPPRGSSTYQLNFTGQPAVQFPSAERTWPLTDAKKSQGASEAQEVSPDLVSSFLPTEPEKAPDHAREERVLINIFAHIVSQGKSISIRISPTSTISELTSLLQHQISPEASMATLNLVY